MAYIYVAVMLVLLGGGGYGVWSYRSAIVEKERAQEEVARAGERADKLRETIGLMEKSISDSQKLASARSARAIQAEAQAGTFREELERMKNESKPASDWANERIPDGILKLREEGRYTPSPSMQGPNDKSKPNADSGKNG